MAELLSIPGIGKTTLELLEAAGFRDAESLAKAGVDELAAELERANSILKISKRAPVRSSVKKWIESARELSGVADEPEREALMPVNYEATAQVVSMLAAAPFAIPLPARILIENQLAVSDIPPAILLNRYSGDLDVRIEQRLPQNRPPKSPVPSGGYVRIAENASLRPEMDSTRFRSTDDRGQVGERVPATKTTVENERVALIRGPRASTNKGRDPRSRWYIRGVLHNHPVPVVVGAAVTLLLMILFPLAVTSALLLLLSRESPTHFSWVPEWFLAFPLALPVVGAAYLIFGLGSSCRICGQKLFAHRSHLKNSRAHHLPGLGYIFPLCVQILLFRWFRCTHCGTPIRLKE